MGKRDAKEIYSKWNRKKRKNKNYSKKIKGKR